MSSTVLVIDTAFDTCQIGVWRNETRLAVQTRQGGGKHDHILADMMQMLLSEQNITMDHIDRILVTIGPGRFTGLRVGIAFARGLALVNDTPVYGVLTTQAMAWDMTHHLTDSHGSAAIVFTVKRGESFVYGFRPTTTPITRVVDTDLRDYFKADQHITLAGVIIPETRALLAQSAHIDVLDALQGPSLDAIYAIGMLQNEPMPVRPYYAA